MHWLWAIIIGFLAGAVAKWFVPGPHGFIVTTLLGIVGAIVATLLGQYIGWYRPGQGAGFVGHCRRRDHFGGLQGLLRRADLTAPGHAGTRRQFSASADQASDIWRARKRLSGVTTSCVAPQATHSRAISKVSGKCVRT
jgi:uncharacterized membrane protein YeaQ/YmgE (transglycosylase-associated protein family)